MATDQPLSDSNFVPVIETVLGTAPPVVLARSALNGAVNVDKWQAIEERIASWTPPEDWPEVRKDDDGYRLPNGKTVAVAQQIATRLRDSGVEVPLRLGHTANGGIKFEWRAGNRTERLTVDAHGKTELVRFEESRLVFRKSIELATAQR